MNSILPMLLSGAAFVVLLVFLAQFAGRIIVSYRITAASVEVRLLGLVVASRTQLQDIVEVRKVSFGELIPWKNPKSIGWFRLGNRFWADGVLIQRSRGIFRAFVISPDQPDDFVDRVRSSLATPRNSH